VLGAGALVFVLQNTDIVALTFLGWQFTSSLAVVVVASMITGILISALAMVPATLSNSFRIMKLKKTNKSLVEEAEANQHAKLASEQATQDSGVIDLRS